MMTSFAVFVHWSTIHMNELYTPTEWWWHALELYFRWSVDTKTHLLPSLYFTLSIWWEAKQWHLPTLRKRQLQCTAAALHVWDLVFKAIYLSLCLSIRLSLCLSVVCLSVSLSIRLPVYFFYFFLFVCLSVGWKTGCVLRWTWICSL